MNFNELQKLFLDNENINIILEKLKVSDGIEKWIDDFQKSDSPQFKNKSKEKRREMAIAAFMDAKENLKEFNNQNKNIKSINKVINNFNNRKNPYDKNNMDDNVKELTKILLYNLNHYIDYNNKFKDVMKYISSLIKNNKLNIDIEELIDIIDSIYLTN